MFRTSWGRLGLPPQCYVEVLVGDSFLSLKRKDDPLASKIFELRPCCGHPCWETWKLTFLPAHDVEDGEGTVRAHLQDISEHYLTTTGRFTAEPFMIVFDITPQYDFVGSGDGANDCKSHVWRARDTDQPRAFPPTGWYIRLALPPRISGSVLRRWSTEAINTLDPDSLTDTLQLFDFVRTIHRAHREIGFFHLVETAANEEVSAVMSRCQAKFGQLERRNIFTDASAKVNRLIVSADGGDVFHDDVSLEHGSDFESEPDICTISRRAFLTLRDVGEKVIRLLALAQWMDTRQRPKWMSSIREKPYFSLRILQYYPGTTHDADGHRQCTTVRHTDATWITLLMEDDCGGLQCMNRAGSFIPVDPVSSGLVVNTGNVLQQASGGYYRAVCHRVLRTDATSEKTRFSIPFFMDQRGSHTGGC